MTIPGQLWVPPWDSDSVMFPLPPQSKDLEQQLQEELLEVVSELQTVRMPISGRLSYYISPAPPPPPGPGRRMVALAFQGPRAWPLLPALGTGWVG